MCNFLADTLYFYLCFPVFSQYASTSKLRSRSESSQAKLSEAEKISKCNDVEFMSYVENSIARNNEFRKGLFFSIQEHLKGV